MMGRSLLVVGWLATGGLLASAALGYLVDDSQGSVELHLMASLVAFSLLLFCHCWVLFYLFGMGRAIRVTVQELGLESALIGEARHHRADSTGWLMAAVLLAAATFLLGVPAYTGGLSSGVHHVLFYLTLPVQIVALRVERRVLAATQRLITGIDRVVAVNQ